MGRVLNQTIWNNVSAYLGIVIGAFNTLVLFPWAFKDNPEYMGLVNLLLSYALVVSTFSQLGSPNLVLRFFPAYKELGKKQLFTFAVVLPMLGVLISAFVFFMWDEALFNWLASDEPGVQNLVQKFGFVLIPLVFFNVYFEVFSSFSQSFIRTVFPMFLKEVIRRVMATVLLVLYFFNIIDFYWFMVLFTFSYALQFVLLVIFLHRNKFLQFAWGFGELKVKMLLDYGFFIFLIAGGNLLIGRIDMIMIGKLAPDALVNVAKYTIAFFIATVIATPSKSLNAIARPLLSKAWEEGDFDQIKRIYKSSSLNQFLFAGALFVIIWTSINPIFGMLPEKFSGGEMAFLFLGLGQVYSMATGANGLIIGASKYYRFNLVSSAILLVTAIILNFWLIPKYGLLGAAMATLFSFLIDNTIKFCYLWVKMKIQPFDRTTLKALLLILAAYFIGVLLPETNIAIINIIYKSALVGGVIAVLSYRLKLSLEINAIIDNALVKMRKWK